MATMHCNGKFSKLTDFRDLWLKRLVSRGVLRENKKKWRKATMHFNAKILKLTDFRVLWLKRLAPRGVLRKNKKNWGMPPFDPNFGP